MERLSGLDATFLYLETPNAPMHIGALLVLRPGPGGDPMADLLARLSARLDDMPLWRRRLMPMPLELDHPAWVDDPTFDLARHVRRVRVPAPGGPAELAALVGRLHARPLDRSRPLWAMRVIEGLADGTVALYAKVHHCALDGAGALAALHALLDGPAPPTRLATPATGTPAAAAPPDEAPPDEVPADERTLLAQALARGVAWPLGAGARLAGLAADALAERRARADRGDVLAPLPFEAPSTPFNGPLGPGRAVAFARLDAARLRAVAEAGGVTRNEAVLALVAGALRGWLARRGALPDAPLVAAVPVIQRPMAELEARSDAARAEANRIAALLVGLATDVADPLDRLAAIRRSSRAARTAHRALPAGSLRQWIVPAGPLLARGLAWLHARGRLAERHPPPFNLVVSTLGRALGPLRLGGSELIAAYPVSVVQDGVGLNITVLPGAEVHAVGIVADAEAVPDPAVLADCLGLALDELEAALGLGPERRLRTAAAAGRRPPTRRA